MASVERAKACQGEGFNCAQAVLLACGKDFGLDPETSFKVAGAFGGGICRTAGMCGAVTGALMALGMKYAMTRVGDQQAKARMYEVGREFMARFAARHGSLVCRDLMGCDLSTPEGQLHAKEKDLHATLCPNFVQSGVEIFNEMMEITPTSNG